MNRDEELHRLELVISNFLRWGVALAAGLLALGWLGQMIQSGDVLAGFHEYRPESLLLIFSRASATRNLGILLSLAGLGVLVALPICRVLLTTYLFIRQRDGYFAAMALFVFCVLLGSFFLGIEI